MRGLLRVALSALLWVAVPSAGFANDEGIQGGQPAEMPEDPSEPQDPCKNPPEEGQPVYLDTGEFVLYPRELSTPDPVLRVRGGTLDLRRTYRSGYAYHGVLGYGWDMAANRRLRRLDNWDVVITTGTCRTARFEFNGSGWDGPPGYARTLVLNPNSTYTERSRDGTEHLFDTDGNLIERRDRHGNRIAFEYSEERMPIVGRSKFFVDATPRVVAFEFQLERILDPTDREVLFAYNAEGRIETITDWIGRTWTYGYDSFGNLAEVTSPATADYPAGTSTTYAYEDPDFPNKITRVVPPNGQATATASIVNFYDDEGRVERQDDGAGGTHLFAYGEDETTVTDPNGTTWIYGWADRQMTSKTVVTRGVRPAAVEPVGTQYSTTYEYTEDLRTRTVYPEGNARDLVYDHANPDPLARANLLELRQLPKPGSAEPAIVTQYTYKTPYYQIGTIEDPLGNVTEFFYDANHNLERIEYPTVPEGDPEELYAINGFGLVESVTDANGNTTLFEYDANGYLDRVTRAYGTALAAPTEFDADAVGRPALVTDARGNATQLFYNAWDRLERRVAAAPFLYETEYSYDPSGNLAVMAEESEIPGDPQTTSFSWNVMNWLETVTNELEETMAYGYDANGNLAAIVDPELNTVTRVWDERNLLYEEEAANGDTVSLQYHENAMLAAVIDGNGNATLYDYDDFDRQDLITHEGGSTEGRTYDPAGNVVGTTTRAGQSFVFGYDDRHRLRSRTTPEEVATFTYDLGGRMATAVNPAASIVFGYNARNELESESTTLAGLGTLVVSHEYDGAGNRERTTYPDSGFVTYEYDELNRLEAILDGGVSQLSSWSYDELSRPASRSLPSGVSSAWTYDRASRVSTITHSDSGGPIEARVYGRDDTGTITSLIDGLGTHVYGYDESKQLTSVDYPAGSAFADTTWTYDDAENRLTEVAGSSTTYVPNALNQYASVGGVTQDYDSNGNLSDDGVNGYSFDSQNRLVGAVADDGAGGEITVSYGYDPFVRRVVKTVDGAITYFFWSGAELIEEYDDAAERQKQYVYGAEYSPVHVRAADGGGGQAIFDVHADHLSTPTLVTDVNGGIVWGGARAVFGEVTVGATGAFVMNIRFPGQYFDAETGLHYNRFRYYDGSTGRYLSPDPIGQLAGANLYRYAENRPLSLFDPLGLDVYINARSVQGLPPGAASHTYISVENKADGSADSSYGSYRNSQGENEVRKNDPSDHGPNALPTNDRTEVPPPPGMTQQEWDDAVESAAQDRMSREPEHYAPVPPFGGIPGLVGNCHSTTAGMLEDAGGGVPSDFNPPGANPGLHPMPPPKPSGGFGGLRHR